MVDSSAGRWVNLTELEHWTRLLGCSERELLRAVRRVGNLLPEVRDELRRAGNYEKRRRRGVTVEARLRNGGTQ